MLSKLFEESNIFFAENFQFLGAPTTFSIPHSGVLNPKILGGDMDQMWLNQLTSLSGNHMSKMLPAKTISFVI